MGCMIHCPANYDYDCEMHEWSLIFCYNDGTVNEVSRYGDCAELIDYCADMLNNTDDMHRIHIWCDLAWWGEVEK